MYVFDALPPSYTLIMYMYTYKYRHMYMYDVYLAPVLLHPSLLDRGSLIIL